MRLLGFIFLFFSVVAVAQQAQQNEQLAAQYMANKEYVKAAAVYEQLYSSGNRSVYLYDNLLACYLALNQFNEAEKLVKKQQKRFDNSAYYLVDQGYVMQKAGSADKAKKQHEQLLAKLNPSHDAINELAAAFKKRALFDYAITTYTKGRKLNNENSLFALELAQLYSEKKETALMLDEYLTAINQNPQMLDEVQGYLQLYLENDTEYGLLKQTLLKRLKDYPANELYTEMLVWLFVQRKDFESALIQTRALDKRNKENGRLIVQLCDLAIANKQFDMAFKGFSEVAAMGVDKPFYTNAKLGQLRARSQKLYYIGNLVLADLTALETDYISFLKEFGSQPYTAQTIKELAQLQAYYLYNYKSAIENYQELINMPRLDNRFKAESKLYLGDIYLLKGEHWEAMLLYGQVDKEFLEDPLGQEAKFRLAKLSYYLGEFDWAKAQLDVLKTATTQLIANNAIELSLQIQDNTIDSNEEPMRWFAAADLNFYQNKIPEALVFLDSINLVYPKHELVDDVIYKRAEIALKSNNTALAATLFEQVYKEHRSGILADNALFMLAELNETKLTQPEKAKQLYETFIEEFPGSFFLTEVRKRYRVLRGDAL